MPEDNSNYSQCQPSPITVSAANLRLLRLHKRYLGHLHEPTDENRQKIHDIITTWLDSSTLDNHEKTDLLKLVTSEDNTPDTDDIIVTRRKNGQTRTLKTCIPLSQVLATAIMALSDQKTKRWPGVCAGFAEAESRLRLLTLDQVNRDVLNTVPALNKNSIRLTWMQSLDTYEGDVLPLSEQDVILQTLRKLLFTVLREDFSCDLTEGRDPEEHQRGNFDRIFRTILLPWLLSNQMPDELLKAMLNRDIPYLISQQLGRLGCLPKDQTDGECPYTEALSALPCDFLPFLAMLNNWLQKHASKLLLNPLAAESHWTDPLVLPVIEWLQSGFKPGRQADIAFFYQIDYVLQQLTAFYAIQTYNSQALLPPGQVRTRYLDALEYLALFNSQELSSTLVTSQFPKGLIKQLKQFEQGYHTWRSISHYDLILSFFKTWNMAASGRHLSVRSHLFSRLSSIFFQDNQRWADSPFNPGATVLYVDDETISRWKRNARNPDDYQINRILLHALIWPPETWGALLTRGIDYVLDYLHDKPHDSQEQRAQLLRLHYTSQGNGSENSVRVTDAFFLSPQLMHPKLSVICTIFLSVAKAPSALLDRMLDPSTGFDALTVDAQGNSLLMIVAQSGGHYDLFMRLLDRGCDPEHTNSKQECVLHMAVSENQTRLVETLIAKGVMLDKQNQRQQTPLLIALKNRNIDLAKRLIEAGSRIDITDECLYHALHYATDSGMPEVAEYILSSRPIDELNMVLNKQTRTGATPLHFAAYHGQTSVVERIVSLIEDLQQLNLATLNGCTALHAAAEGSHVDAMAVLLRAGANPDVETKKGCTPIFRAQGLCFDLLIRHGANINHKNALGDNCLLDAIRQNNERMALVPAFLDARINLYERDAEGRTAAMLLICFALNPTLKLLLAKGLDTRSRFSVSKTCLNNLCVELLEHYPEGWPIVEYVDAYISRQLRKGRDENNLTINLYNFARLFKNEEARRMIIDMRIAPRPSQITPSDPRFFSQTSAAASSRAQTNERATDGQGRNKIPRMN